MTVRPTSAVPTGAPPCPRNEAAVGPRDNPRVGAMLLGFSSGAGVRVCNAYGVLCPSFIERGESGTRKTLYPGISGNASAALIEQAGALGEPLGELLLLFSALASLHNASTSAVGAELGLRG